MPEQRGWRGPFRAVQVRVSGDARRTWPAYASIWSLPSRTVAGPKSEGKVHEFTRQPAPCLAAQGELALRYITSRERSMKNGVH